MGSLMYSKWAVSWDHLQAKVLTNRPSMTPHSTRFGTRQHFDFLVMIKDNTINDNVVPSGCRVCAIYSVPAAWIVRQEIE